MAEMQAPHPLDTEDAIADLPALLKVSQAARELSLGRTKVYELINAKQLEAVKVGSSTRVTRRGLARYLNSLEVKQ